MNSIILFLIITNIVLCNGLNINLFNNHNNPLLNNYLKRFNTNKKIIRFGLDEVNMTPVVFMHGLFSSYKDAYGLMEVLIEEHPGQPIYFLDIDNNFDSFKSLKLQVPEIQSLIRQIIKEKPDEFKDGFHFIGHSQGGLLSRCIIEESTDFIIKNYISLAGVQNGEFGNCELIASILNRTFNCSDASYILYSKLFRDTISVAQFWRDINYSYYIEWNQFLPYMNNEIKTDYSNKRKKNFMSVENVYLFASRDDELIAPWQSSHFGFYADNDNNTILPMEKQNIYINDLFGLKSLDKQQKLHLIEIPGVFHGEWIRNKNLIKKEILPLLYSNK